MKYKQGDCVRHRVGKKNLFLQVDDYLGERKSKFPDSKDMSVYHCCWFDLNNNYCEGVFGEEELFEIV